MPEDQNIEPVSEMPVDNSADIELSDQERIAQLEAELSEAKDQFLRSCAEIENQRRRALDDIKNAKKFAASKFAKELLSVKDSLEMALLDQSNQFDTLKLGVELTLKQLVAAFDAEQIKQIDPQGEKLDPHLHHAIGAEESTLPANTVIKVLQKGYVIAERVLRPAMVVVAKVAVEQKTDE